MGNRIYCIIVTYNAIKWIDKCLTSLRISTIPILPIVVDNNSTDETVNHIKDNYPEVYLICNRSNKGFGQANNQGIEYAYKQGGTHFFLLNQDAWLSECNTLEKLVLIQNKNNIGIVSPIHLNGIGDKLDFGFYQCCYYNYDFVSASVLRNFKDFYMVEKVNAAAWIISREAIEKIGGFDPLFFHYGEDNNYVQRLRYHGLSIAVVPSAFIHHDRNFHGNEKVYNERKYISAAFVEYANINKSIFILDKSRLKFILSHLMEIIGSLLKLNISCFLKIVKSDYSVLINIKKICVSMNKNKKEGMNWLNLKNRYE